MAKVILIGEALIDQIKNQKVNSIINKPGGAPANVGAAIAKLGVEAIFLGAIGKDHFGEQIKQSMINHKIKIDGLVFKNKPTTLAQVAIDNQGERSFTFKRGSDGDFEIQDLNKNVWADYDILHLGSATALLGNKLWKSYLTMLKDGLRKNKIIIFDPNYREALFKNNLHLFIKRAQKIIAKSDIVKVSETELKIITGISNLKKATNYLLALKAKIILVTLGSKGTLLATNQQFITIPSIKTTQVDSTGAGDAFIGYLIGQIANHKINKDQLVKSNLKKIIFKANICGAITVSRIGAFEAIPTKQEVEKMFLKVEKEKLKI